MTFPSLSPNQRIRTRKMTIFTIIHITYFKYMKIAYLIITAFSFFTIHSVWSGTNPLWEEYLLNQKEKVYYLEIKPFTSLPANKLMKSHSLVSVMSCFELRKTEMEFIKRYKPEQIQLSMADHEGQTLSFFLVRQTLASESSRMLSPDSLHNQKLDLEGVYYRGVIAQFPGSLAAISFFDDEIMGVASLPDRGNLVLGKPEANAAETSIPFHALYYEKDLPIQSDFVCGTIDQASTILQIPDSLYTERCKTVKIFLECDYKLYQDKNRSIVNVKNFITGLFNVVKTLYFNERVNIEISDIMVWSVQDPFLHTSLAEILYHYAAYRQNNFSGNLAQLVSRFTPQQQGGIAFLGTLCQPFNGQSGPHSYAYINNNYNQLPTYSWSVEVMAHELGHNFGSPHTHACFWGPSRNQTLDNCQPPENNGCAAGPTPIGGGTIMSYCHLTSYGINFSKGFGQEPGELLRNSVQNRSCISPSFVPSISPSVAGPYFEDDQVMLKARPSNDSYQYHWFHYDYQLPNENDSILQVPYSGQFKAAISNKCTEYSAAEQMVLSDFLVNLGCPVLKGKRDSVKTSLVIQVDQGTQRDTLEVPQSLFNAVPSNALDVLVELQLTISPMGSSWTRDVSTSYTGPDHTGIFSAKFQPNAVEPPLFNGSKTYSKILGRFDPTGSWKFSTNDNKFDNGIDALAEFSIVISWRDKDSIPPCNIALCDGQPKIFDAGIPTAKYKWSTGDSTKIIEVDKPGSLTVEVSRGLKKASHTVHLVHYNTHYKQQMVLCSGDTLRIGNQRYFASGSYSDTLKASNGCDSIIETQLEVLPEKRIIENVFTCYGDLFQSRPYFSDTAIIQYFMAMDGCDSIREYRLKVNPKINIDRQLTSECPEIGGTIEATARGGAGAPFSYLWSTGDTIPMIRGLQNGYYSVTISDMNRCSDTAEIQLINLDSVGITPLVFDVSCFGSSDGRIFIDFISGRGPFEVLWSTGETSKDIGPLSTGVYSLSVTDMNGCKLQRNILVREPDSLMVDLKINHSINRDGSVKLTINGGSPPYIILWSTGDTLNEIFDLDPGDYWISVYDKNGCNSFVPFKIQQVIASELVPSDIKLKLTPNPAISKLIVEFEDSNYGSYSWNWSISSIAGQNISRFNSEGAKFEIDVGHLWPGIYFLRGKMDHGYSLFKIIKI